MDKNKSYNVESLSDQDLHETSGGGIIKRFGNWLGGFWKSGRCGCGGDYYQADFSDLRGPKW
jgi:hypothetical protein